MLQGLIYVFQNMLSILEMISTTRLRSITFGAFDASFMNQKLSLISCLLNFYIDSPHVTLCHSIMMISRSYERFRVTSNP